MGRAAAADLLAVPDDQRVPLVEPLNVGADVTKKVAAVALVDPLPRR